MCLTWRLPKCRLAADEQPDLFILCLVPERGPAGGTSECTPKCSKPCMPTYKSFTACPWVGLTARRQTISPLSSSPDSPLTMLASRILTFLTAASVAFAAPSPQTHCSTSKDTLTMPSTANSSTMPLVPPPPGALTFIGVGVGVQNYTCASTGTYSYVIFGAYCCRPLTNYLQIHRGCRGDLRHLLSS